MSQWTHIRGGLELYCSPFAEKPMKDPRPKKEDFETEEAYDKADDEWRDKWRRSFYLPFPEEQFKLDMPKLGNYYDRKTKEEGKTLDFNARVYSLPRVKPIIEKAFELMPQGESGLRYSIDQNITDSSSSSSGFILPCLFKYYKDALTKMYHSEDPWHSYTYEDLRKYMNINEDCSYGEITKVLIGIRDDIRYASAVEVQLGLEKLFKYLTDHGIGIEDGCLEWEDEWDPCHIHGWRLSRLSSVITHQFYILDKRTGMITHSKTWVAKRDEKGKLIHDEDWNYEYEVVEKDGPFTVQEGED